MKLLKVLIKQLEFINIFNWTHFWCHILSLDEISSKIKAVLVSLSLLLLSTLVVFLVAK